VSREFHRKEQITVSMKIGETNYPTFDDLGNDSILTPAEKADSQLKVELMGKSEVYKKLAEAEEQLAQGVPLLDGEEVFKKLRTKLAIAEQSRLAGEPTVSLEEAKAYLEENYEIFKLGEK
jgi:hypothetical protein